MTASGSRRSRRHARVSERGRGRLHPRFGWPFSVSPRAADPPPHPRTATPTTLERRNRASPDVRTIGTNLASTIVFGPWRSKNVYDLVDLPAGGGGTGARWLRVCRSSLDSKSRNVVAAVTSASMIAGMASPESLARTTGGSAPRGRSPPGGASGTWATASTSGRGGRNQRSRPASHHDDDQDEIDRAREGRRVLAALALDHRREAREPLVPHLLEEPADVRPLVGGRRRSRKPTTRPLASRMPTSANTAFTVIRRPSRSQPSSAKAGAAASVPPKSCPNSGGVIATNDTTSTARATVPRRRESPCGERGDEHRGGGEDRGRLVADAGEADADRRRVAEHRIELEWPPVNWSTTSTASNAPRAQSSAPRGRRRPRNRQARRTRRRTARRTSQYAALPPCSPKWRSVAGMVARRKPMGASATHCNTGGATGDAQERRRDDQEQRAGDGEDDRGPQDGRGHRVHEVVAQQPIGVRLSSSARRSAACRGRRRRASAGPPSISAWRCRAGRARWARRRPGSRSPNGGSSPIGASPGRPGARIRRR